jgi:hypothetical protein
MHKKIVLNPESNRFVKINSAKYKRLVKEGVIQVQTPEPAEEVKPAETPPPPPPTPPPSPALPKAEIAEQCVNIVAQNKSKFENLSKEETDILLRTLLVEKLFGKMSTKEVKQKKKAKFKVKVEQPPSSESESESESD